MPKTIRVPIPDEDTDLVWYFDEQVENDQFGLTLDYSVREHDERAEIDEVRISEVEVSADGVRVHYEIDWSAHYGCSDMNCADTARHFGVSHVPEPRFQDFGPSRCANGPPCHQTPPGAHRAAKA